VHYKLVHVGEEKERGVRGEEREEEKGDARP
jgi:hypothetical protein